MDNQTSTFDYVAFSALIVSAMAFAYTVWRDRVTDKRLKMVEKEQEREKQDAAIRISKASAPYLTPSKKLFSQIYDTDEKNGVIAWPCTFRNVLTLQNQEIGNDAPEGTPIILPLDNLSGHAARNIRISGDIPKFELRQEPDIRDANRQIFAKYPYSLALFGKTQKITFCFETAGGFDLTHTYETRHGFFEFYRVDPK